jgi:hypothetical protein
MTKQGLLVATVTLLLTLGSVDFVFGRYARSRFLPETYFRAALAEGRGCIVTLGDSRMLEGVKPEVFRSELARQGLDSCHAQLAIGGGQVSAQYAALRRYIEEEGRVPRLLIWGINPDVAAPFTRSPDLFTGNNAVVLSWSRTSDVWLHYPGFPLENFDDGFRFLAARSTNLSSYASLLWNAVQRVQDRFTRPASPAERNRFGLVSDMAALEKTMARELTEGARSKLAVSAHVTALASLCQKHGIPMLWVEMPMPEHHHRQIEGHPNTLRIRRELARLATTSNGSFESMGDASWRDPRLFGDALHLGAAGAERFSRELAERVVKALAGAPAASPARQDL